VCDGGYYKQRGQIDMSVTTRLKMSTIPDFFCTTSLTQLQDVIEYE